MRYAVAWVVAVTVVIAAAKVFVVEVVVHLIIVGQNRVVYTVVCATWVHGVVFGLLTGLARPVDRKKSPSVTRSRGEEEDNIFRLSFTQRDL